MKEPILHIYAPKPTERFKRRRICPTCRKRTTFIVSCYEWYGANFQCLNCGDQWSDGERLERPFAPGWRKRAIAKARWRWREERR